jgi:hypothetical protein
LGEERDTSQGAKRHRRTSDLISREPTIPLPILSHFALELLKAALNIFVADEPTVDDPRELTYKTMAQTAFYTHIEVWTARLPLSDRGP